MGAEVELLYDVPRLEEKLILKALRSLGVEVRPTNVKSTPLSWSEAPAPIALVRPVSMQRAVYAASVREAAGVRAINGSAAILLAGDKVLTLGRLKRAGLRFPETLVAFSAEAAEKAGAIIGYPAIDKPPVGSWGRLVALVKDSQCLRSVVEHRELLPSQTARTHVIQRYVDGGRVDYRVLVLGGEPLGAMVRVAREGEWRSNVARGGKAEKVELGDELSELAVKAAEAVGGEFVAVDLLRDGEAFLVNEVNGVPEFKGFMEATGVDVASRLAEYVKTVCRR